MTITDAVIQGIVQGLTEFLPVSSSGHLAITQHILGTGGESNLFFNVMLHVGTLVAVVAFYYKLIWSLIKEFFVMIKDIFTGKFKWSEMNYERNLIFMLIIALLPLFLLFVPIPGTDLKVKDIADILSASPVLTVTAASLILTSVLLTLGIIFNRKNNSASAPVNRHLRKSVKVSGKPKESYTVTDAVCVGLTQVAAAILPGLSRSGSTLAVGEMRGVSKQKALDFTFILGVPSILAAALLEGADALSTPGAISVEPLTLIAGVLASAVVGYLSIVIFKWFLKSDKMIIFVIYTAIAGVAFLVISLIELNSGVNLFTGVPIR